jgi:hypothetical protein
MPFETVIALTLIVGAFAIFAASLFWAEHQTRTGSR